MQRYFAYDYDGPGFELFGTGHLVYLAILAALIAFLIWGWQVPNRKSRDRVRLLIATIMLLNEIAWHSWNIGTGAWSIRENLPLHLCGISIWSTIYMLYTRDYRLYQIIFFVGLGGAAQAVITPSAGEYGLPHFRAFQTLISHGMLVLAMIFLTTIEGQRPTWMSLWKTMLALNVYLVVVTAINYALGSNYMFTLEKPHTASLFDVMGPWPWYLLAAEVLAVILFALLYLPFALSDRRLRRQVVSSGEGSRAENA
ncbi:MAG: TIGR02206 family membrane protein [Woeseiaceae bacterium]|nr:TIGR02206 family membrane protein [Woeseiaceae bacterium]